MYLIVDIPPSLVWEYNASDSMIIIDAVNIIMFYYWMS